MIYQQKHGENIKNEFQKLLLLSVTALICFVCFVAKTRRKKKNIRTHTRIHADNTKISTKSKRIQEDLYLNERAKGWMETMSEWKQASQSTYGVYA